MPDTTTLRDQFAGLAMAKVIPADLASLTDTEMVMLAKLAYRMADAMLHAR